ncbi:MAG: alpha/beta hydrolase, partial [Betaproteobacteria bacterium]
MQKAVVGLALFTSILAGCATHSGKPSTAIQPVRETHGYSAEKAVIYTPPAWPQALPADIYRPDGAGPFPGVLMVHGGGWHEGKRKHMGRFSKMLARRGYVVVNIDYRLAPQFHFPAQIEDLREAVRWMRANAVSLKLDPMRIGAWGYSAGAHLVALLGTDNEGPATRVSAVVAGGLPSDFSDYPDSPLIRDFIGATPAENPQAWT